jgi:hypothetical protein
MRKVVVAVGLLVLAALTPTVAVAQDGNTAPPPVAQQPLAQPQSAPAAGGPAATLTTTRGAAPALAGPTVWGLLGWYGVGVGARYMIPLGIPALLTRTRLHDSWALELGADFLHRSADFGTVNYSYNQAIPSVGMMWIVWLRDDFAVYPKAEAGYAIGFGNSYNDCVGCSVSNIYAEGAAGLLYKVSQLTLRAEIGNYGAKGGIAWLF